MFANSKGNVVDSSPSLVNADRERQQPLMSRFTHRLKFLIPRQVRNAMRAPKQTLQAMEKAWSYRWGGRENLEVRPGWKVCCHPASIESFRVCVEREEFSQELDGFIRHAAPGMTLLDIGSHYGVFTLAALHYGGPESFVAAIDPSKDVRAIFVANVDLAGVADRVWFIQSALGASEGFLDMLSTNAAGEQMFVASPHRNDTLRIPMTTLSSIAEKMQRLPTHIKIDVEGFEGDVLQGGLTFIARQKPIIFLELHNQMIRNAGNSPQEVLQSLASLGYTFESGGKLIRIEEATRSDICRLVGKCL
jgi:FkbM family methyltransferase